LENIERLGAPLMLRRWTPADGCRERGYEQPRPEPQVKC